MRRDVFQAIADPTRREILHIVSKKTLNINAVTEQFDVTRAAIYKHLKILTQCGLIEIKQRGRERFCEGKLDRLKEVANWLEQYRKYWNERLDTLELYLRESQTNKSSEENSE